MVAAEAEAAAPTLPAASRVDRAASPRSRAALELPGQAWRPAKKADSAFSRPEYISVGPERSTLAETLHGGDAHEGYTQFAFAQGSRYVGKNFSAGQSPFAGGFSRPEYMDSGPRKEGSDEQSPRHKGGGFYMHRCASARGFCVPACALHVALPRVWRALQRRSRVARVTPNAFLLCSDCASPLPAKTNKSFLSVPEHTPPGGDVYASAPNNGIACGLPRSRGMQARADMGLFPLCFGAAVSSAASVSSCCACPAAADAPGPASRRVAAKPRTGRQQRVVPKASGRRRLSAGRWVLTT